MYAQPQPQTTGRYIDLFPYIPWLLTGGMVFALIFGALWERTMVSTNLLVNPDTAAELKPIQLKKEPIGALRIDVNASISYNQWVTYEIQVKDQQGKVLASGIKQAWAESGTWVEEGESGTWAENDLMGGLDVRANQSEPVIIAIDVLEYSDTAGKEIDKPVSFQVIVKNGVVDDRYLWTGLFGTLLLSVLALFTVSSTGKVVINKSNPDSDVVARAICGNKDRLIRVVVKVQSDEYSPSSLHIRLTVNDANGEQLYSQTHLVNVKRSKSDGKVTSGSSALTTFFVLEPRGSYGFHAEVTPDASVDRTRIIVRENARTLFPVKVVTLKSSDAQ
ncbi:MAG: hypothetical protein IGS48_16515 [Oscillatoriales cyanobacterium C42_A2020_001]|nr:hypothetical protein [Leptolyngbyaceae cyanobacterium C42_A2020_001]